MDAVGLLDLSAARVNHSGSGSEQYPPSLMLGLLIYSYATGTFSSRKIEKNSHEPVAVRLLCADHRPDHDSTPLEDELTVPAEVARRQNRGSKNCAPPKGREPRINTTSPTPRAGS